MVSVPMAMQITCSSHTGISKPSSQSFFIPNPLNPSPNKAVFIIPRAANKGNAIKIEASFKDKIIIGATTGVLTAAMLAPDVAQAASGVSPSLKNFLLSIGAGTIVVVVIIGAVVGVSNFDPVKRN